MSVLITGINGFVGTILRQALEKKGYQVYGLDTKSDDSRVYPVDITDQAAVTDCLKKLSPEFIYHLAAISWVDAGNPSLLYSINVTGTLNLLSAAARLARIPEFLLVSSAQVYGVVDEAVQPIHEAFPISPVNHYGASKAAAEHIAQVFHSENHLPLVVVRPFNHTGRGQNPHFIIPKIISAIREKKSTIELGNLSVIRDFMDVRDVVDIYIRIMERFPEGEVFNVASGIGYRLLDLLHLIQNLSNSSLDVRQSSSLIRKNEITKLVGDISALRKRFNWKPSHDMEDTLKWILSE